MTQPSKLQRLLWTIPPRARDRAVLVCCALWVLAVLFTGCLAFAQGHP